MDLGTDNPITMPPPGKVVAIRRRRMGLGLVRRWVSDITRRLLRRGQGTEDPNDGTLTTSREWLQSVGCTINVLFSIAEAIPVVGPAIKGALEALYKVLQLIEVGDASSPTRSTEPLRHQRRA
jgi:hypothetical protein